MKLNASALRIALLCGSLLLSLNAPSAQKHRSSKPRKSQPQQAKPQTPQPETPKPHPPSLEGSYTLNDPAAATKTVNKAIEATVKEVGWLLRGLARDKLKAKNLPPPPQIIISYTTTEVSIATERTGTIQTPVDGTFVDRTILGEKLKVNSKWQDGKLGRTFKGGDGERVNTYSLSGDGNTLTMQVRLTSPRLPRACAYQLSYKRTTK